MALGGNIEEKELYQGNCQYVGCGKSFESHRRWAKKYCSDSCRTLASRYRKDGVSGSKIVNPRTKGVNDVYELINARHEELLSRLSSLHIYVIESMSKINIIELEVEQIGRRIENIQRVIERIDARDNSDLNSIKNSISTIEMKLKYK